MTIRRLGGAWDGWQYVGNATDRALMRGPGRATVNGDGGWRGDGSG